MNLGWILWLWLAMSAESVSDYNIDDAHLFKIDFDGTYLGESAASHLETILMRSANNEEYSCAIPKLELSDPDSSEPYTGNNALEILQQLFLTQSCAYRLEHYWTYELCHGRYIKQFHEEREGKNVKVDLL